MYDFIVKTYDKRTLYFFLHKGLCVKNLLKSDNKYSVIYEDAVKDFAVEDMGFGKVSIVCQNNEGSIVFIREEDNGYTKTILLKNKSKVYYDKYFHLKLQGNWLGLSYIIEYNGKNILSYQIIDNENEPPMAVDYILGKRYFSFVDSDFNRVFFYNKDNEFGIKIFRWSKKNFDGYKKLDDGELLSVINDFNDNYYLVYMKENKCYLKIIKGESEEGEESDYPLDFINLFDEVNLLIENNNLWITVKRYNFTFGKKINKEDVSFSPSYNFFCDKEIKNISLAIHDKDIKCETCFGSVADFKPELLLYKNICDFKNSHIFLNEISSETPQIPNPLNIAVSKLEIRIKELESKIKELEGEAQRKEN